MVNLNRRNDFAIWDTITSALAIWATDLRDVVICRARFGIARQLVTLAVYFDANEPSSGMLLRPPTTTCSFSVVSEPSAR